MNSTDIGELHGLELIAESYGDVFEGFEDFDRALRAAEEFIRLVKDLRVNGYIKRAILGFWRVCVVVGLPRPPLLLSLVLSQHPS